MDDETYRAAGKTIRRQMALEKADENDLASWASIPLDQILPLTSGLPGPWPLSAMVAVSVALNWPADGVERLLGGEDPETFEWRKLSEATERMMDEDEVRQAAVLISYVGGDVRQGLLDAIRTAVDAHAVWPEPD